MRKMASKKQNGIMISLINEFIVRVSEFHEMLEGQLRCCFPIFKFSATIKEKVIYTMNAIESPHSIYRKFNRHMCISPSDTALLKPLYPATFDTTKKWAVTSTTGRNSGAS